MSAFSITSKGQVTIPKDVRQRLGLRAGSKVRFRVVGDRAEIERVGPPPATVTESAAGMLPHRAPPCPADFDVAGLLDPVAGSRKRKRKR